MVTRCYLPMSVAQARDYLRDPAERLVAALSDPSVDTQVAFDVGSRLVARGFTGAQSLSRTFDVLGAALPAAAGLVAANSAGKAQKSSCGRLIKLLGALADGYSWALRNRIVDLSPVGIANVTDLHLLERRLHHQTLHDVRTGLPNRQYLTTYLERVLARVDPSAVITLIHLDLDGFSTISDGLGHHAGDRLLDVVARRLERAVADQQTMVARLGADEYAILIEPGDSVPDVGAFAEIINTELAEPFYIDRIGVALTASIGAVQRPAGETTAEELIRAASATLRRMRGWSKRQWTLFDQNADATDRTELRLAAAMPGALETGELAVTYQPVVMLDGGQLVGIEAALSWLHPQLGVLSHDQCVRAAERTGLVHEAGQWLLRTAAKQTVSWRRRIGPSVPPVVVNLSPSQAQDRNLVARVSAVLDDTGLPPAQLELRAPVAAIRTVTGELADVGGGHAEDNARALAELGVRLGLYDFGGGIGGLRCLADLPVCTVRIAEPVSHQVAADPSRILSQAAQALVHIVRGASIDVVAFPVDSAEQAACWPWIGANWGLGALFGEPGSAASMEKRLRRA